MFVCLVDSTEGKKIESFLPCVKTRTKRRNENKFYKFIWLSDEENYFLRFYQLEN